MFEEVDREGIRGQLRLIELRKPLNRFKITSWASSTLYCRRGVGVGSGSVFES